MLLFIYKMGIHWYFWFAVKTANNGDKLKKNISFETNVTTCTWAIICNVYDLNNQLVEE